MPHRSDFWLISVRICIMPNAGPRAVASWPTWLYMLYRDAGSKIKHHCSRSRPKASTTGQTKSKHEDMTDSAMRDEHITSIRPTQRWQGDKSSVEAGLSAGMGSVLVMRPGAGSGDGEPYRADARARCDTQTKRRGRTTGAEQKSLLYTDAD